MPRRNRTPKKQQTTVREAIIHKLVYGHWWGFLYGNEGVYPEPPKEKLQPFWDSLRDEILDKNPHPWALDAFDGDGVDTHLHQDDFIYSKADEMAVRNGCWFDGAAALRCVAFFETFLRHSKGEWAGQSFTLMDWQKKDVLMPLFGWKRPNGTRRFRQGFVEIPKKNGKSAMCSGIGLYLLVGDGEPGAEIYCAGADRQQASIVFDEAQNMVLASPVLKSFLYLVPSKKTIEYSGTRSFYRALSADVATSEGLNIHGLIFDELHAQRNRDLFDSLRYGGAARRQPLLVSITTAGWDRNSICYEQLDYAKKVLDGIVQDDSFFAYIRDTDIEKDDWTKPETWHKANPSLGITISEESFSQDCIEAQESPTKENTFKRYRLNIWTESETGWISMDKWDSCDNKVNPNLIGKTCCAGLDLSSTCDITALVLVFKDEHGFYDLIPYFWVPEENARVRERKDRVPYLTWARQGHIELTDGNVIDQDHIRKRISEIGNIYHLHEIAIDRWNSTQLQIQLSADGFTVVPFGQGMSSMTSPTKELEKLILSGRLRHGGNPVLRWMASNAVAKQDSAENIKLDKERSTEKIDGLIAAVMGLGRCIHMKEKTGIYEDRGIFIL